MCNELLSSIRPTPRAISKNSFPAMSHIALHRCLDCSTSRKGVEMNTENRPQIIVVGAGYAGTMAANKLAASGEVTVTLPL